jgi:hypothetical protein
MRRKAQCCCGACVIEVEGEPTLNGVCHCHDCQKRTGSPFGWSAYFKDEQIAGKTGAFGEYAVASAFPAIRWFCQACGSTMMWKTDYFPDQTGFAGGCFVETPLPEPAFVASVDKRRDWALLPAHWPILP